MSPTTPPAAAAPGFTIRFTPAADLHATLDAIRAQIDLWDTRLTPAHGSADAGLPLAFPANSSADRHSRE